MSKKVKVKKGNLTKKEERIGYLFILPWLLGVIGLVIYPLAESFKYSLYTIRMTPKGRIFNWVGIQNYLDIWQKDVMFPTDLMGYAVNTLLAVPVIVVFALIIALLLNSDIKFKGFFRLIFFLPVIIVSGPVMSQLSDQGAATVPSMNTAMIYQLMSGFLPKFLAEAVTNLFDSMIMILWYAGVQILLFLAGLQKIDRSLYEAARIDGSSTWEEFWKITLPTIKSMILLVAVYTVIFLSNNEQNVVIVSIQQAMFDVSRGYGYASAMAWMYALIVTGIVLLVGLLFVTKKDAYEKKARLHKKEMKKEERQIRKIRRRDKKNNKGKEKKYAKIKNEN